MDTIIKVNNIGKRYRVGLEEQKKDTLAAEMASWIKYPVKNFRNLRKLSRFSEDDAPDVVWALKNISFEVKKGEVLGIIGHNGAGKSTLLKILSRITDPSIGEIEITGRVSSLLEVGTGFHPELTGRENIYMNGTILGMTKKEIDSKFDEILEFSGISKYIDTPVKRYSSGMKVRLAFSVAAHLEPEILIIDEVLAVGDVAFQKKCIGKMEDVAGSGRTVLFVSHNMGAVKKLCTRGIVLSGGKMIFDGDITSVINKYLDEGENSAKELTLVKDTDKPITINKLSVNTPGKNKLQPIEFTDIINIELEYTVNEDIAGSNIAITLSNEGSVIFRSWDVDSNQDILINRKKGSYKAIIAIPKGILNVGRYSISVAAGQPNVGKFFSYNDILVFHLENNHIDTSHSSLSRGGILALPVEWNIKQLEQQS